MVLGPATSVSVKYKGTSRWLLASVCFVAIKHLEPVFHLLSLSGLIGMLEREKILKCLTDGCGVRISILIRRYMLIPSAFTASRFTERSVDKSRLGTFGLSVLPLDPLALQSGLRNLLGVLTLSRLINNEDNESGTYRARKFDDTPSTDEITATVVDRSIYRKIPRMDLRLIRASPMTSIRCRGRIGQTVCAPLQATVGGDPGTETKDTDRYAVHDRRPTGIFGQYDLPSS